MAEANNEIDEIFRDKLTNHSEKPSPLAWGKLENRLEREKKGIYFQWLKVAASILLAVGLASVLWYNWRSTEEALNTLAQKETLGEGSPMASPSLEPAGKGPAVFDSADEFASIPKQILPPKIPAKAVEPEKEKERPTALQKNNEIPIHPGDGPDLPPLDAGLWLADIGLAGQEVKEVAYTVRIVSNGIQDQPGKESLIAEIEEKIDKIGGVLNKVDEGFADLQDAKNKLFTSMLTPKKENKN